MIGPQELTGACRKLPSTPPSDTDIRRAISTTYCALLHTLAASNAKLIAGQPRSSRSAPAWDRVCPASGFASAGQSQCLFLVHAMLANLRSSSWSSAVCSKFPKSGLGSLRWASKTWIAMTVSHNSSQAWQNAIRRSGTVA